MSSCVEDENLQLQCSLAWLKGLNNEYMEEPFFGVDGDLKLKVVAVLASATCYMKAFTAIFPFETWIEEKTNETFWPIIYGLARHGIYAVEGDGQSVNHAALSQRAPFRKSSHVALLHALMRAHVSSVVTVPHAVRTIRNISAINTAHELPTNPEEALLLWLCKVSEAVTCKGKQEVTQRKVQTVIAQPRTILEAVSGGQSLPALLVYYCQEDYKLEDFSFQATFLTPEEALRNTLIFTHFSECNLPPFSFHIPPDVLTTKDSITKLRTNVLALLARIFDYFAPKGSIKGSSPVLHESLNRSVNVAREPVLKQIGVGEDIGTHSLKKSLLPLRSKLHLSNLNTKRTSTNDCKFGSKGVSLPSTVLDISNATTNSTSTCSGEHNAEGMVNELKKKKRSAGRRKKQQKQVRCSVELPSESEGLLSSRYNYNSGILMTTNFDSSVALEHMKDMSSTSSSPELKRSFTLNKQHTVASACKAGLPIIEVEMAASGLGNRCSGVFQNEKFQDTPETYGLLQPVCEISQFSVLYDFSHIAVYVPDLPEQGEVELEKYLKRRFDVAMSGFNVKNTVWRQRFKERKDVNISSCVVPKIPDKLTFFIPSDSTSHPPETARQFEARNSAVIGHQDSPNCMQGSLPQGINADPFQSPPGSKDDTGQLQERHHMLRKRVEKRLKRAQTSSRRISRDSSVHSKDKVPDLNEPSSPFILHNGPECYVKPSAKSNRKIIRNALCHVCLAGDVNASTKLLALKELDSNTALHFFILFKHIISFTFRGLYSYTEEGKVSKIFGTGPRVVHEHMIDHFYKYNSGSKDFLKIHSHTFSLSVDAFTLKQEVWTLRRTKH